MKNKTDNYLITLIELRDENSLVAYIKKQMRENGEQLKPLLRDALEFSLHMQLNYKGRYDFFRMTELLSDFNPEISERSYRCLLNLIDERRSTGTLPASGESDFYRNIRAVSKSPHFDVRFTIENTNGNNGFSKLSARASVSKDIKVIQLFHSLGEDFQSMCTNNYYPIDLLCRELKTSETARELECLVAMIEMGADPYRKCKVDSLSTIELYRSKGLDVAVNAITAAINHKEASKAISLNNTLHARQNRNL